MLWSDLLLAVPFIAAVFFLGKSDALKVLVLVLGIVAGVAAVLYARIDRGMSWGDLNALIDGWIGAALLVVATLVALALPFLVNGILSRRREHAEADARIARRLGSGQ